MKKIHNIIKRMRAFKNWPLFVWPMTHIGSKTRVAILRDGTRIIMRNIFSSDFSITLELAPSNYYGTENVELPLSGSIVDAGANIGVFAISIARKFPNNTVYAIEPEEDNYKQLLKNIELNKVHNVVPIKAALSSEKGQKTLYLSKFNSAHSTQRLGGAETQTIPAVTLDSFPQISFLKVDIEGGEFDVFRKNIPDCDYIVMEIHATQDETEENLINNFKGKYEITNESPIYKLRKLQKK